MTYTLQLPLEDLLKAECLRTTVATGGPYESGALAHCSCCWGPFWKQSSYTIQLLFGTPSKAE